MTLLQILVVLAVVAAVAAVAAGVLRGSASEELGLPEPTTTIPTLHLPTDQLTATDVDRVRFSIGFRGYRMDEVDQVLDRLSGELSSRDAQIAELHERLAGPRPTASAADSSQVQGAPGQPAESVLVDAPAEPLERDAEGGQWSSSQPAPEPDLGDGPTPPGDGLGDRDR